MSASRRSSEARLTATVQDRDKKHDRDRCPHQKTDAIDGPLYARDRAIAMCVDNARDLAHVAAEPVHAPFPELHHRFGLYAGRINEGPGDRARVVVRNKREIINRGRGLHQVKARQLRPDLRDRREQHALAAQIRVEIRSAPRGNESADARLLIELIPQHVVDVGPHRRKAGNRRKRLRDERADIEAAGHEQRDHDDGKAYRSEGRPAACATHREAEYSTVPATPLCEVFPAYAAERDMYADRSRSARDAGNRRPCGRDDCNIGVGCERLP